MVVENVLVLGATGGIGRALIEQAASGPFRVTAMVRDPSRLPKTADRVRVVTGDVLKDGATLRNALDGQHAVVSALGVGPSFRSHGLIGRAAPVLVAAMREAGVKRLVFTSAFGVGSTRQDTPWMPRLFIATLLRDVYRDKEAGERAIESSELDWTLVCPVGLTNGPRTGRYRTGERLSLNGFPRISRSDVAEFLLHQVQDESYRRTRVLIASA
jgi:putative NADH-flavin reductase